MIKIYFLKNILVNKKKDITVFNHASLDTFLEAAGPAPIAVNPVNKAGSLVLAEVLTFHANGTLEETGTAITRVDTIVFTGTIIPTDLAQDVILDATL
jgi:hypothetical protein